MQTEPLVPRRRVRRPSSTGVLRAGLTLALPALALAAAAHSGCSRPGEGGSASAADSQVSGGVRARELPKVRVAPVVRREMVQVLETMTKLESEREIELFPRSAGVVIAVLAEEGDHVEKGQVLAAMDARDEALAVDEARVAWEEAQNTQEVRDLAATEAEARIESARLAADQAERDYQRNQALFEGEGTDVRAVSEQALEASLLERDRAKHEQALAVLAHQKAILDAKLQKTATARAKLALDRAELALSYKQLTAPFAGVVARRDVRVGDTVGTGQPTFVLSDIEALRAVFNRPQEELARFRGGLENGDAGASAQLSIEAEAEALPGVVFPGHVVRVSPTIDPESGQFRVTARLEDGEAVGGAQLLPGMLVRMQIVTDRHPDVLVVPKRALRREGDRRHLLVVEREQGGDGLRGTLRRVDVAEGYDDDENVEVAPLDDDPLAPDDLVVVIGSRELEAGDPVRLDESRAREHETGAAGTEPPTAASEEDAPVEADAQPGVGTDTAGARDADDDAALAGGDAREE